LMSVASSLASTEHGEEYASAIREASVRRELVQSADRVLAQPGDVEGLVSGMESAVFSARSRMQGESGTRVHSSASILSPLDAFLRAPQAQGGLPYPFPYLRENYGVFERGRYAILAGYSNDGKTTALFQWVEEMCVAGGRVCVYEMEMTELAVARMLVLQGAGITSRQAKGIDPMTEADHARYEDRKKMVAGFIASHATSNAPSSRCHRSRRRRTALVPARPRRCSVAPGRWKRMSTRSSSSTGLGLGGDALIAPNC
jgi:replicative DNA helicase